MNLNNLKYAVEVEKTKSITKAADNLFMGQPNLSRSIRELEESIGIQIFMRSPKGVVPTEQGQQFLIYAKNILAQIDEMEEMFRPDKVNKYKFSLSTVRAGYIVHTFGEIVSGLDMSKGMEFTLKETNNTRTINNVAQNNYNLGIIRYRSSEEKYYKKLLKDKKLLSALIWEFKNILLMHKNHPLAEKQDITDADLLDYIEISPEEKYIPTASDSGISMDSFINQNGSKRINVSEWGSCLDLLSQINQSYMWTSAVPSEILKRYSLVQKKYNSMDEGCKDVLIYKDCYQFNDIDKKFIEELEKSRDEASLQCK